MEILATDREAVCGKRSVLVPRPNDFHCPPPRIATLNLVTVTAVQHLETYWAILQKVKGSSLRLTKMDNDIFDHLKTDFPEFDPAVTINEEEMKSKTGKERWRKFMTAYEKKIDDYNFGTMLRTSPKVEYEQNTTIFGMCSHHGAMSPSCPLSRNAMTDGAR